MTDASQTGSSGRRTRRVVACLLAIGVAAACTVPPRVISFRAGAPGRIWLCLPEGTVLTYTLDSLPEDPEGPWEAVPPLAVRPLDGPVRLGICEVSVQEVRKIPPREVVLEESSVPRPASERFMSGTGASIHITTASPDLVRIVRRTFLHGPLYCLRFRYSTGADSAFWFGNSAAGILGLSGPDAERADLIAPSPGLLVMADGRRDREIRPYAPTGLWRGQDVLGEGRLTVDRVRDWGESPHHRWTWTDRIGLVAWTSSTAWWGPAVPWGHRRRAEWVLREIRRPSPE